MRFGVVLILFLLSACAQVGTLSGGPDDEFAPQPKLEKMSPKNASTSFSGHEITIPFDEFIKLNNPNETIIVVPPNLKPVAKIKNKTLILSWKEDLLPNTTYAFYLNGTVQDTKENNDSLMTFVFSTGNFIDSLSAQFIVVDAFSNEPQKGIIVGLYDTFSDTLRPTYFAQTDARGWANLQYLKTGNYEVVAFLDKNKDLIHQADEQIAFKNDHLSVLENSSDSIPLRLYPPLQKPNITSFKFNPPGSFLVAANRSLEKARFEINGQTVPSEKCVYFSSDSLLLPFHPADSNLYTLITRTSDWIDTTSVRLSKKEKNKSIRLQLEKGSEIYPKKSFSLISSAEITQINTRLIKIENPQDSSNLGVTSILSNGNRLEMNFDREDVLQANLIFLPGAIIGEHGSNTDTILIKTTCLSPKDLGNMEVDFTAFTEPIILELLLGKEKKESIPFSQSVRKHRFTNLKPGEYSFRIVYDENENGRWDVGDKALKMQPEFVEKFTETQKVRANWDVEVVLKKTNNGDE